MTRGVQAQKINKYNFITSVSLYKNSFNDRRKKERKKARKNAEKKERKKELQERKTERKKINFRKERKNFRKERDRVRHRVRDGVAVCSYVMYLLYRTKACSRLVSSA